MICPVCQQDPCQAWDMQQSQTWHPVAHVPPGELKPCGENTTGSVLEFFANADDIPDLLANGITATIDGVVTRFMVRPSSTPCYGNGDKQIQAFRQ